MTEKTTVRTPLPPLPVVCGGGARRGGYLVGLFRLIEEVGLVVPHYTGISSGSLIAALYTNGKTPDEIGEILKDELFKYSLYAWVNPKVGSLAFATTRKTTGPPGGTGCCCCARGWTPGV